MKQQFTRKLVKLDATDQAIGRLATKIAIALRGKDQPEYMPNLDHGAIVEVSNIAKAKFTGNKLAQSVYHSFSGYPGGLKTVKQSVVFANKPGEVLKRAVREMLPDNRLRSGMLKRLNIK